MIYSKGLTSYSGTTFRVIIRYWHDLFSLSNTGTTFFGRSDTGTTSAFPLRWHFLFFPPPPGCHVVLLILSLSLFILFLSLLVSLSSSASFLFLHGDVDDGDPPGANSRGRRRFFRAAAAWRRHVRRGRRGAVDRVNGLLSGICGLSHIFFSGFIGGDAASKVLLGLFWGSELLLVRKRTRRKLKKEEMR